MLLIVFFPYHAENEKGTGGCPKITFSLIGGSLLVIPAQAGIHVFQAFKWTPAFAGVTDSCRISLFWDSLTVLFSSLFGLPHT